MLEELVPNVAVPVSSILAREHFRHGKAEGFTEGLAEGGAHAVLLVLEARDLEVTPADRARIFACADPGQLRTWVTRAATVAAASDLYHQPRRKSWFVTGQHAKENFGRGKAEGFISGLTEGQADSVLLVLRARGLEVTLADRVRIFACTDLAQLRIWVARAAVVDATSDLFCEDQQADAAG